MTILLLEDNALDAELMAHQLAEALPAIPIRIVNDRCSYAAAIEHAGLSLIVSDFSLPDIDGWTALRMAAASVPEVPVIFVSGVIGEDLAVKALKAGATDYIVKQRLERLGAAARRALSEAEDRRARQRAEGALRDSEARFRTLADVAPALIWETDAQGALIFANRHYEAMFGVPGTTMLGEGWLRTLLESDRPAAMQAFRTAIAQRQALQMEMRVVDSTAKLRWLQFQAVPRFDHGGHFLGLTGTAMDVTETKQARDELEHTVEKRTAELLRTNERLLQEMQQRAQAESARQQAEELLCQAQKMEVFGQLTGGVAHDFNNFLTVILGNLETLERLLAHGMPDDTRRLDMAMAHAKQGAQRAAALTQRLLAFARRQPVQPCCVNVNQLVSATLEILTRTLGEQVGLRTDLAADLWPTHVDPHMLESALLNLAVNARDAMPHGGVIRISTKNIPSDDEEAAAGDYVRVSLSDTGVGISADIIEKVFEPFFTTKDVGVGTGLGLSQVYGFAKQSGGYVRIESLEGEGTTVHIDLPRFAGEAEYAVEPAQDNGTPTACVGETILVVEDDEAVRTHSASVLADLGYTVLQAGDAASALQILQAKPEISLLFTDVGLPQGYNGPDLADTARTLRPSLRVLYTSGYAEGRLTHGGKLPPGVELIPKPFTLSALAHRIRDILDRVDTAGAVRLPAPPRVLIVEDDELVRMLAVEALKEYGYEVVEAGNAQQALVAMHAASESIGAAIVDVGLPDMPGDELVRRLVADDPHLAVIVASGYGEVDLGEARRDGDRIAFLAKPYDFDSLYAVLRDLGVFPARRAA